MFLAHWGREGEGGREREGGREGKRGRKREGGRERGRERRGWEGGIE